MSTRRIMFLVPPVAALLCGCPQLPVTKGGYEVCSVEYDRPERLPFRLQERDRIVIDEIDLVTDVNIEFTKDGTVQRLPMIAFGDGQQLATLRVLRPGPYDKPTQAPEAVEPSAESPIGELAQEPGAVRPPIQGPFGEPEKASDVYLITIVDETRRFKRSLYSPSPEKPPGNCQLTKETRLITIRFCLPNGGTWACPGSGNPHGGDGHATK